VRKTGAVLRVVPIDDTGAVHLEEFEKLLGPRTRFVALSYVSNALGTILPVKAMVARAHAHGVPVLVDAAQAVPHLHVDVQDLDCDFWCFRVTSCTGRPASVCSTASARISKPCRRGKAAAT
jgi:cysteine desulfurase/selenocysteine lyase